MNAWSERGQEELADVREERMWVRRREMTGLGHSGGEPSKPREAEEEV